MKHNYILLDDNIFELSFLLSFRQLFSLSCIKKYSKILIFNVYKIDTISYINSTQKINLDDRFKYIRKLILHEEADIQATRITSLTSLKITSDDISFIRDRLRKCKLNINLKSLYLNFSDCTCYNEMNFITILLCFVHLKKLKIKSCDNQKIIRKFNNTYLESLLLK